MNAHAAQDLETDAPSAGAGGLAAALFAGARHHPRRTALRDAGDRRAWNGRPSITWTYDATAEIVGRLARGIASWRLPAGSHIGLCYAGGAEASLAHLAVEAAGHIPCLLSPLWDAEALSVAIETAKLSAVLSEGRRGARRPADELAQAAIRHFGLRFIAAFGPSLPDGVISLDALALERGIAESQPSRGVVTFAGGDPRNPIYRSAAALDAAITAHLERLPPTDRILTLLPSHDLRGLATGLGAALASGSMVETLIPFDSGAFGIALVRPIPTRLVIPAEFEAAVTAMSLPWTVRAIDVVHRAPANLPEPAAKDFSGPPRLDVLVLGERALITRPRGRWDIPVDAEGDVERDFGERGPILTRGPDGSLRCSGLASCAAPLQCSERHLSATDSQHKTTYRSVFRGDKLTVVPIG